MIRTRYEIDNSELYDDQYDRLLVGPDGFSCFLGEPEDCTWIRDGSQVVNELNNLLDKIDSLENKISILEKEIENIYKR